MLLQVKNLTKNYTRAGKSFAAVDHLDLSIEAGEFVHITGRSGSGKSTLLSLVAGLLTPDEGEILYGDEPFHSWDEEQRARYRNSHIGVVPQLSTLLGSLNILENVLLPWYLQKREGDSYGRARYLLDKLGIRHLETSYPKTLSGGEIRRALLARALMNEPKLLLADEPTSDLDPENTAEVMKLFKSLNDEGVTLLVVTHELDTLEYGSRVLQLSEGRFVEETRHD